MSTYLDTTICLLLIIIVFSTVTYVIQELIAINLKYRGKMLWNSMSQLLDGIVQKKRGDINNNIKSKISPNTAANNPPGNNNLTTTITTNDFFNHPQIKILCKNLENL